MDTNVLSIIEEKLYCDRDGNLWRRYKAGDKLVKTSTHNTLKIGKYIIYVPKAIWFLNTGIYPEKGFFGFRDGNRDNFKFSNLIGLWATGDEFKSDRLKELFYHDPDSGLLYRKYALPGAKPGVCTTNLDGYYSVKYFGVNNLVHRLVWLMYNDDIPEGMVIDHINHDKTDNRIKNLRVVTRKENAMNRARKSEKKHNLPMGIQKTTSNKYKARIDIDGKRHYLGTFNTVEEASAAWNGGKAMLGFHTNHGVV